MLDIGASTGMWLDILRDKFDCEVLGIEPSEHFRMYARDNYKVDMFSEMDFLYTPEHFNAYDMITVIHTLEHMNDPVGFLTSLHEFVTEDGHLYIEVPNVFTEVTFTISHPHAFSPTTLEKALRMSGWEIEWMELYHGIRKGRTVAPYILVKAKPGTVDDFITQPNIEEIRKMHAEGMVQMSKDIENMRDGACS